MIEIITHTPTWVFLLFFFLLFLGLNQKKDRKVSFRKMIIFPVCMLFLSIWGVFSVLGLDFFSFTIYLSGLLLGIFLTILLKLPRNSEFLKEEKQFFIKGSILPLFLIMCIFFTKYFVGVVTARELELINSIYFIAIISFLYGFFSGMIFGRIFVLRKMLK